MRLPLDDPRHDEALHLLASAAVCKGESMITLAAVDALEIIRKRALEAKMHSAFSLYSKSLFSAYLTSSGATTKHGAEEFRRLADECCEAAAGETSR